jgi:scyllo-inositol 2-dehydrogenase (NADP+)
MKSYSSPSAIKVGVVGYGGAFNMGKAHLQEMQQSGMTPIAVAELDAERLAVATTDFPGIATYRNVEEMLAKSDVDLITVITPHNTHAALGQQILSAGRHCVLEKPMAVTTEECDALIATAREQDVLVSTYHNRHWDGWIMKALEVVQSGTIGDIVRIDLRMGSHATPKKWWRSSRTISGGVLYDWGVHLLEYALQLMPADVTEVSGYAFEGHWASQPDAAFPPTDANEDEAQVVVRFATGQRVNLTVTQLDTNPKRGFMEVVGTKGAFLWADWASCEIIEALPDLARRVTTIPLPKSEGWRFYQNIADHLTKGTPLVITGEWARRPIHILDLAARSAREGRALPALYR